MRKDTLHRIDWDAFHTLERIARLSLMAGEARTLTYEETDAINASLRAALSAAEPAVELLGEAKSRFLDRM